MTENAFSALLDGLSREWTTIGNEILRLGDALGENVEGRTDIIRMQSFDALAQNAFAQSRLIGGLAHLVRDDELDNTAMLALTADIPFMSVRQRLRALLGVMPEVANEELSDDDAIAVWRTLAEDGQAGAS